MAWVSVKVLFSGGRGYLIASRLCFLMGVVVNLQPCCTETGCAVHDWVPRQRTWESEKPKHGVYNVQCEVTFFLVTNFDVSVWGLHQSPKRVANDGMCLSCVPVSLCVLGDSYGYVVLLDEQHLLVADLLSALLLLHCVWVHYRDCRTGLAIVFLSLYTCVWVASECLWAERES